MKLRTAWLKVVAAVMLTGPVGAQAAIVEISGHGAADGFWEVTTVMGPLLEFDRANSQQQQVWWEDSGLALAFAEALGSALGFPNNPTGDRENAFGPVFAAFLSGSGENFEAYRCLASGVCGADRLITADPFIFAIANRLPASVPEPGTLLLLGVGLFGVAALRRRVAAA